MENFRQHQEARLPVAQDRWDNDEDMSVGWKACRENGKMVAVVPQISSHAKNPKHSPEKAFTGQKESLAGLVNGLGYLLVRLHCYLTLN